ncbi:MAG: hypothetical protein RIS44_2086 [Pseudomonadota bacterium]|jgi:hypothetical protein
MNNLIIRAGLILESCAFVQRGRLALLLGVRT